LRAKSKPKQSSVSSKSQETRWKETKTKNIDVSIVFRKKEELIPISAPSSNKETQVVEDNLCNNKEIFAFHEAEIEGCNLANEVVQYLEDSKDDDLLPRNEDPTVGL
jgi:predicted HNH restriction endonuclease